MVGAEHAFCAILDSGHITMWGENSGYPICVVPGDISVIVPPLRILDIKGVGFATFVALLDDWSVMCWDAEEDTTDEISAVRYTEIVDSYCCVKLDVQKSVIKEVNVSSFAVCVSTNDNIIHVWGHEGLGGTLPVQDSWLRLSFHHINI